MDDYWEFLLTIILLIMTLLFVNCHIYEECSFDHKEFVANLLLLIHFFLQLFECFGHQLNWCVRGNLHKHLADKKSCKNGRDTSETSKCSKFSSLIYTKLSVAMHAGTENGSVLKEMKSCGCFPILLLPTQYRHIVTYFIG